MSRLIARRPLLLPVAVLMVGLILSGVAAFFVSRSDESAAADRFDRDATVLAAAVDAETRAIFDQLTAAGAFFAIAPRPSQEATYDYLAQVGLDDSPWLRDLGWAESVPPDEVDEFVARERANGLRDFAVESATGGNDEELVVVTRGSTSSVETLIGLDLASFGPIATRVFAAPLSRGEPWFTRVTTPVADLINRSRGDLQVEADNLIGILPTWDSDGRLTGWLLARINPEQLLAADAAQALRSRLELRDPQPGTFTDPVVAESGIDRAPDGQDAYEMVHSFRAGGITWDLTLSAHKEDRALPLIIFGLGGALSLLVGLVILGRRRTNEVKGRLSESERRLREDSLTGLPNRLGLEEALKRTISERAHEGQAAALFLDIDRFKLINDSLGHSAGDELLVALAGRLTGAIRRGDVVGRFGGDEFLVVICEIEDTEDALAQARRIMGELEAPMQLSFGETQVHASIGVRIIDSDDGDGGAEGVIRDADIAMFAAKRTGDGIRVFDSDMRRAAGDRLVLERALIEAVAADDLSLEYQPIVDEDGNLAAVEGLLRWHHRELGHVPPAHFLPVAEEVGLMPEIGRQVVRSAVAQAARWNRTFDSQLQVAINVTGAELYDPDFPHFVAAELRHHQVPAEQMMLEISEELLLEASTVLQVNLDRLRDLGVGLALDDFGTGRSSLSQAGRLSTVTEFKLDRSLVTGVDEPEGQVIVRAASDLAAGLGQQVVAEGVEEVGQRDFLVDLGISRFQGFLYSPSVPASRISGWLADGGAVKDGPAPRRRVAQPSS